MKFAEIWNLMIRWLLDDEIWLFDIAERLDQTPIVRHVSDLGPPLCIFFPPWIPAAIRASVFHSKKWLSPLILRVCQACQALIRWVGSTLALFSAEDPRNFKDPSRRKESPLLHLRYQSSVWIFVTWCILKFSLPIPLQFILWEKCFLSPPSRANFGSCCPSISDSQEDLGEKVCEAWLLMFPVLGWKSKVNLVGGLEPFYFSMYRECHHPNWCSYIFRGVAQPPTSHLSSTIIHYHALLSSIK